MMELPQVAGIKQKRFKTLTDGIAFLQVGAWEAFKSMKAKCLHVTLNVVLESLSGNLDCLRECLEKYPHPHSREGKCTLLYIYVLGLAEYVAAKGDASTRLLTADQYLIYCPYLSTHGRCLFKFREH